MNSLRIFSFAVALLAHLTATAASSTSICDELRQLATTSHGMPSNVPPVVRYAPTALLDGITGPLIALAPATAPLFSQAVADQCRALNLPVPHLYLNMDPTWRVCMAQGSLTPRYSYIVIGRHFINRPDVDDLALMDCLLHEHGHNALYHNFKAALLTLTSIAATAAPWLISTDASPATKGCCSAALASAAALTLLAYARSIEYAADRYAIDHCTDPERILERVNFMLARVEAAETAPHRPTSLSNKCARFFSQLVSNYPTARDMLRAQKAALEKVTGKSL